MSSTTVEFDKEAAEKYDEKEHIQDFVVAVHNLLSSWKWLSESSKPLTILDFGCGTGNHTLGIAQYGHNVTAADVSPEMLNKLRIKLQDTTPLLLKKQVTLVQSKQDGSGFASEYYDAVVIIFVMHHVPANEKRELVISNLAKTLKPSGRLVVLELEETERSKASFASFHPQDTQPQNMHSDTETRKQGDDKNPTTNHVDNHDDHHHGHKHDWLDRKTVASWMTNAGLDTIVNQSFEIPHQNGIMDCYFVTGIRS